jgi:hypothetical protein
MGSIPLLTYILIYYVYYVTELTNTGFKYVKPYVSGT